MRTSIGARANLQLIEENYRRWQRNPESVDSGWSAFFEGFELGNLPQRDGAAAAEAREAALQTRIDGLIYAYCSLGHTIARVDPLAETRPQNPLLSLREFGIHPHPGSASARLDSQAIGDATPQAFDSRGSAGGAVTGVA
jgi:2-oxoglutarate dehydrogenase E1 component